MCQLVRRPRAPERARTLTRTRTHTLTHTLTRSHARSHARAHARARSHAHALSPPTYANGSTRRPARAPSGLPARAQWLNLPKKHKMVAPSYQPILAKSIPEVPVEAEGEAECGANPATVRIIAGEFRGSKGPATTFSPVELWDVSIPEVGKPIVLHLPEGHTGIVFVRRGALAIGAEGEEQAVGPQGVALLEGAGSSMRLVAKEEGTQLLMLGGEPLNEPIAAQGPFVMNTRKEIMEANMDFQEGRMGR